MRFFLKELELALSNIFGRDHCCLEYRNFMVLYYI